MTTRDFLLAAFEEAVQPFVEVGTLTGSKHPASPSDGAWIELELDAPRRTIRVELDFKVSFK